MTNNNQKIASAEDRELFHNIAKEIRNNPDKYLETGRWLDKYCSEDAYWQRQEDKLHKIGRDSSFRTYWEVWKAQRLEQKIRERRTPALIILFQEAQNYLLEKYEDQQFIPKDDAKRIILITWILTDPDAEKTNLNITQLEKWPWQPIDDVTKMSRGYAQFLLFHGGRIYRPWMRLVRVAWDKLCVDEGYKVDSSQIQEKKGTLAKNFVDNLLRASIKHLPFCGSFLYDVIYGTIDSQASHKETIRQPKTQQSGSIFEKQKTVAKHKPDAEKTYQNVSLKIAKITLYAAIITLFGAISTSPLWRPVIEKWTGETNMTKIISSEKKLLYSLKEICQDIDSRPLVQRVETAKRYIGIKIERERLKLFDIHEYPEDGTFGLTMTLPDEIDESYLTGRKIFCTVERNQYPELNAAKKGLQLYVSGQIKDAGSSYIRLSDVSLSFE